MTVGIDARALYLPVLKGIGVYLQNLLNSLAALDGGHEYVLFFDSRQEITRRRPPHACFRESGLVIPRGDTFFLWEQLRLPLELRRRSLDVFHSPANTTPLWKPCPTVATVHDTKLLEAEYEGLKPDLYNKKVQPAALRRAEKILCPSRFSKGRILDRLGIEETRVEVTYPGISEDFRVIDDRDRLQGIRETFGLTREYVFSAGGESPPKNISALIAAFAAFRQKSRAEAQLVIAGIRTRSIYQKHRAEGDSYGLGRDLVILGYVSQEDLIALYNAARIFVYPSLFEGFGFPPLEAMACGVPVAASGATSIPEVVGDAALLFDAASREDMTDKMARLWEDRSLREKLRLQGFERVKQFSWAETARKTLSVYQALKV